MADMIPMINGVDAVAAVGGPQSLWHRKGQTIDPEAAKDIFKAMDLAQMNISVAKQPLYLADGSQIPDRSAIVRDDGKYLATVGKDYSIVQYRDTFGPIGDLLDRFNLSIDVCGLQDEGRRAWVLTRVHNAQCEPVPGDKVDGYLSFHSSHDGSWAWSVRPSIIREVCKNTSAMVLRDHRKAWMSLRHTTNIAARQDEFKDRMASVLEMMEQTGATLRELHSMQMGQDEIYNFVKALTPFKGEDEGKEASPQNTRARESLMTAIFAGPGADAAGVDMGSLTASRYAVFNGVTFYFDHLKPEQAGKPSAAARAEDSALFGANWDTKLRALEMLMPVRKLVAA